MGIVEAMGTMAAMAAAAIAAAVGLGGAEIPSPLVPVQSGEAVKKPAAAAAKSPAKKPMAPTAKPAAAARKPEPAGKPDPVAATDDPADPYIRLDGRLRETVYEMRYSLTTFVMRADGARRHLLAVQVTHHDEAPRVYARAERDGAPALAMTATQRPSRQCVRNRDRTQTCFHDEAYVIEMTDADLAAGRKAGMNLRLAAASAAPMTLQVEAATIDAQLSAADRAAARRF